MGCSPGSCFSVCHAGSRCSLRRRFSERRADTGCNQHNCFSVCHEGTGCSARSGISLCCADTDCRPGSAFFVSRANIVCSPSLAAEHLINSPHTCASSARRDVHLPCGVTAKA
jgi:hypothetical protein